MRPLRVVGGTTPCEIPVWLVINDGWPARDAKPGWIVDVITGILLWFARDVGMADMPTWLTAAGGKGAIPTGGTWTGGIDATGGIPGCITDVSPVGGAGGIGVIPGWLGIGIGVMPGWLGTPGIPGMRGAVWRGSCDGMIAWGGLAGISGICGCVEIRGWIWEAGWGGNNGWGGLGGGPPTNGGEVTGEGLPDGGEIAFAKAGGWLEVGSLAIINKPELGSGGIGGFDCTGGAETKTNQEHYDD